MNDTTPHNNEAQTAHAEWPSVHDTDANMAAWVRKHWNTIERGLEALETRANQRASETCFALSEDVKNVSSPPPTAQGVEGLREALERGIWQIANELPGYASNWEIACADLALVEQAANSYLALTHPREQQREDEGEKPAVYYCENGKSLDGLEQGALAVLSNLMIKTNATTADFMIANEKDGEFYFHCSRQSSGRGEGEK